MGLTPDIYFEDRLCTFEEFVHAFEVAPVGFSFAREPKYKQDLLKVSATEVKWCNGGKGPDNYPFDFHQYKRLAFGGRRQLAAYLNKIDENLLWE